MLATRQLEVALGGRTVLTDVTLSLSGGTVIGLIGPNGAGKTTLLRALTGIIPEDAGVITLDDRPLAGWPRRTLARNITYVAQDAPCSWPMTVRRVVALGRLPHLQPWQQPTPADGEAIEEVLQQADVLFLDNRNILTLSGGERARVMLACALAGGPRFLVADEAVAGLDPAHQLQVMALLRARAKAGAGHRSETGTGRRRAGSGRLASRNRQCGRRHRLGPGRGRWLRRRRRLRLVRQRRGARIPDRFDSKPFSAVSAGGTPSRN